MRKLLLASGAHDVGSIVLTELPFLVCPVDLKAAYKRFLSLTDVELIKLQQFEVNVTLMSVERSLVESFLPERHKLVEPFLWFLGVLKCHAHGSNQAAHLWLLYEQASLAQHSCDPNIVYRNEGGTLIYIAIKRIEPGDPITLSYIGSLYGSTRSRQERLLQTKLTLCKCDVCTQPLDRARRIWCPHCRTKNGDPGFAVYCGESANVNIPQIEAIKSMNKSVGGDGWWMCTQCRVPLADAVMPISMEEMLTNLYTSLNRCLGLEEPNNWMTHLTYMYRTTLMVLGPMHWLVGAAYFLFSKFYASAWKSTEDRKHEDLAMSNGLKYIEFVEALNEGKQAAIQYTDLVPWSCVLMKIALQSADYGNFSRLAAKYMSKCGVVYGAADSAIRLFHEAIVLIHRMGPSNPDLAEKIQSLLKEQKSIPKPQIQVDECKRSTTWLEKNFAPKFTPWLSSPTAIRAPPTQTRATVSPSVPAPQPNLAPLTSTLMMEASPMAMEPVTPPANYKSTIVRSIPEPSPGFGTRSGDGVPYGRVIKSSSTRPTDSQRQLNCSDLLSRRYETPTLKSNTFDRGVYHREIPEWSTPTTTISRQSGRSTRETSCDHHIRGTSRGKSYDGAQHVPPNSARVTTKRETPLGPCHSPTPPRTHHHRHRSPKQSRSSTRQQRSSASRGNITAAESRGYTFIEKILGGAKCTDGGHENSSKRASRRSLIT